MDVGARIRTMRRARKLSQLELAKKAGLSRTSIASIESGLFKSTRVKTLDKIAIALQVETFTLLM